MSKPHFRMNDTVAISFALYIIQKIHLYTFIFLGLCALTSLVQHIRIVKDNIRAMWHYFISYPHIWSKNLNNTKDGAIHLSFSYIRIIVTAGQSGVNANLCLSEILQAGGFHMYTNNRSRWYFIKQIGMCKVYYCIYSPDSGGEHLLALFLNCRGNYMHFSKM